MTQAKHIIVETRRGNYKALYMGWDNRGEYPTPENAERVLAEYDEELRTNKAKSAAADKSYPR